MCKKCGDTHNLGSAPSYTSGRYWDGRASQPGEHKILVATTLLNYETLPVLGDEVSRGYLTVAMRAPLYALTWAHTYFRNKTSQENWSFRTVDVFQYILLETAEPEALLWQAVLTQGYCGTVVDPSTVALWRVKQEERWLGHECSTEQFRLSYRAWAITRDTVAMKELPKPVTFGEGLRQWATKHNV